MASLISCRCSPRPRMRFDLVISPALLVGVQRARLPGGDLAEVAPPGAHLAADQERRLAVLPALEDVRAARLLADRVQAVAAHQLLQLGVLRPGAQPGLDPRGLPLDRGLAVARLQAQHPPSVRCEYHVPSLRVPRAGRCRAPGSAAAPVADAG